MKKKKWLIAVGILFFMGNDLLDSPVWGEIPGMVNYQGRLVQNSSLVNSNSMTVTLSMYNASTGGSLIYQEDDTVDVTDGLYTTYLGDNGNGSGSESDLTAALTVAGTNAWLGVTIDGFELTPRERLLAAPYALVTPTSGGNLSGLSGFTNLICDGPINCDLTFTIDFNPPFNQAPIVTLSAQATSSLAGVSAQPFVLRTTPSNFTAQVTATENAVKISTAVSDNYNDSKYTSLATVNGKPAISFQKGAEVWYVCADNADGTAWGSPQLIETVGNSGAAPSLAVFNGVPAISYYHPTYYHLKFVQANDADGTSWGMPIILDPGGRAKSSLAIIEGKPAVSYKNIQMNAIAYKRASDASGTSWEPAVSTAKDGQYNSLALVNGKPAISFYFGDNLMYERANDSYGDFWTNTPTTIASGMGAHINSLAIVNSHPAISYHDNQGYDLKYVRSSDSSGVLWASPIPVDTSNGVGIVVGYYSSLAIVNGNAAISYYDSSNDMLKYVNALDPDGDSWAPPVTVDNDGNAGTYTSMTIVNGEPAVSYIADKEV
ncbi:MAG: hypothetical protein GKR87_06235 [Kiritimatiellae bacterium]|nr:hypothetical protein [Kiritimatiellia bacterium]